jgi:cathepsin H
MKSRCRTELFPNASPRNYYGKNCPDYFDWRNKGVVSSVKNQAHCGSCWNFSTVGAWETHYTIKYNKFVNMSEQPLVDCTGDYDNKGCSGGLPSHAFNYIRDHCLPTKDTYPYFTEDHNCTYNSESQGVVTTDGPFNITAGDEDQLKDELCHQGCIYVAFQVVAGFRDYTS